MFLDIYAYTFIYILKFDVELAVEVRVDGDTTAGLLDEEVSFDGCQHASTQWNRNVIR